jgi:hypothetical protein
MPMYYFHLTGRPTICSKAGRRSRNRPVRPSPPPPELLVRRQEAVAAKGAEIWDNAREKVREWGEEVATRLDDTTSLAKSTGQAFLDASAPDLRDQVEDVAAKAADKSRDEDTRNNLLLGLAGLAIAAALGIACQKKITDTAAV